MLYKKERKKKSQLYKSFSPCFQMEGDPLHLLEHLASVSGPLEPLLADERIHVCPWTSVSPVRGYRRTLACWATRGCLPSCSECSPQQGPGLQTPLCTGAETAEVGVGHSRRQMQLLQLCVSSIAHQHFEGILTLFCCSGSWDTCRGGCKWAPDTLRQWRPSPCGCPALERVPNNATWEGNQLQFMQLITKTRKSQKSNDFQISRIRALCAPGIIIYVITCLRWDVWNLPYFGSGVRMSFTGEYGPGPTSVAAPNLKKYWVPLDKPWTSILVMLPTKEIFIDIFWLKTLGQPDISAQSQGRWHSPSSESFSHRSSGWLRLLLYKIQ